MKTLKTKTWPRMFLVLAVLTGFAQPSFAQPGKLDLQNLEKLANKASSVTDVTLDGSLLGLAIKVLDMAHDEDTQRVKDAIKGVKGIYVRAFEFDQPNQYDQADVQAIRAQLTHAPWSRIVGVVEKRHGINQEHSEIFVMKDGDKIGGLAILVAEAKELTVVNIVGFVDIDKLADLGGKFGIPDEIKDKGDDDQSKRKPASQHKNDKSGKDKKDDAHDDMVDMAEE